MVKHLVHDRLFLTNAQSADRVSVETDLDKLEKEAEKIAAQFDKSTEDAERAGLSNARTIADQAVRNYQNVFRAANYVARGVIDGLNGYVGAGIGAYESSKS